ncbi:MAG: toxin-antitoxin system YwqK family antitoxin, partial [Campylobacterota bacterium]|nr:toxin-antitoxin system YwqK family antitoxin [Campylobacterota bacterium]
VFYYDNGRVKKRENFKNGKRDGTCKRYYVNGNIQIINSYRDGKKDGLFKKIYENGKLYQEVIFKNDKVVNAFAYDENSLRGSLIGKYEDEIIVD